MAGALEGVVVLDLTQQLAGPGGTMLFGDMGADVIRVEPPPARAGKGADLPSRASLNIGRSKTQYRARPNQTRGTRNRICDRAPRRCRVPELSSGVAEKLGMNLESLRNVNPQIIYSRVSAYGDRGPEAFRAGFDVVSQSGAGTMVAGPDGKMPAPEKIPIGDVTGFCLETIGILAALYHRKITGEAQAVSTSMLAGSLLQNILRMVSVDRTDCEWRSEAISRSRELIRGGAPYRDVLRATATASGGEPQSRDRNDPMVAVYYRTYHTKDGYIAVGCRNLRQQRRLNELLSLGDPRFEPGANRNSLTTPEAQQRRSRMAGKADAEFASRSTAEMLEILEAGEIACGPIVTTLETFDSRQLLENEYVVEQVHPGFGPTKLLGFPISFEKTPMRISRPAPAVGSDGDEVMAWLGYDQERVRDLRARQIVC